MKNPWMKHLAGLTAAGAVCLAGQTAFADYSKLLQTLEKNGAITAEQAESLKAQSVRPVSKFVQDLQIRGRVQTQFGYVEAENDEGSSDYSTFEIRRARIGLRGTFPNKVRAEVEINAVPEEDFSVRSAFIQWREHDAAMVKVGYDKPITSIEENTSSASIITVERSLVNNTIAAPGETTGILVEGDLGTVYYGLGLFNDEGNRNTDNEKSEYLFNAHAGLNLGSMVGEGNTLKVQGSFLSSDDPNGNLAYDEVTIAGIHFAAGKFDLRTEYMIGDTDGVETSGFYVMPSVMLSEKLQGVVRVEMAESDKSTGLRAASRYTRRVDSLATVETENADGTVSVFDPQRGDEYQAVYVGVNYYLKGDGNKLMLGLESAELDNTKSGKLDSTTVYTAWRTLF